jgi:hypothetical protein
MFSRDTYEIAHILGIALLFAAMGGVAVHAANGGTRVNSRTRTVISVVYVLGALLVLTGGFGMMARLKLFGPPPAWLAIKMGIWLVITALVLLPYRSPSLSKPLFVALPFLAGVAAYCAVFKPFL